MTVTAAVTATVTLTVNVKVTVTVNVNVNRICMSAGNLEESNGVLQREGVLARHESRCEGCERCDTKPGRGLERLWFTARYIMPEEKHVEAVGTVPLGEKRKPFCTDDSEELPREL